MPEPPRPYVHPRDLLIASQVRKLCGIAPGSRATLLRWRRDRDFPEPIRSIRVGHGRRSQMIELWDKRDVKQWLAEHPPFTREIRPGS